MKAKPTEPGRVVISTQGHDAGRWHVIVSVEGKGASGGPIADSDIRAALRAVRNAYETRTGSAPMRARPEKDKEEGALVQK